MPTRNLYLQELDGSLLITPTALANPVTNIFDKPFNPDMEIEEWNDWMRWDGTLAETASILLGGEGSIENTFSNFGIVDLAPLSASSMETDFSPENAPLELDETTQSQHFLTLSEMQMDARRPARGYSTLTAAEEQSLQDIAMPYRMLSQVNFSSEPTPLTPSASAQSCSSFPEPETKTRKTRKRKSSIQYDDMPNALCQTKKRGHNAIEKRYRTNLNDKIACLGQGIPPLRKMSSMDSKSGDEGDNSDNDTVDKTGQQKYGKAAILTRALEYIQHLECTTQRLGGEVVTLKTRVGAFERLAMSSGIVMNGAPTPSGLLTPKKETLQNIQAGTFFHSSVRIYETNLHRFQANNGSFKISLRRSGN
jgi:hypothetical protein